MLLLAQQGNATPPTRGLTGKHHGKTAYLVTLGFECPKTGHWLPAGKRVEMTETESLQLVLSGHLVPELGYWETTAEMLNASLPELHFPWLTRCALW